MVVGWRVGGRMIVRPTHPPAEPEAVRVTVYDLTSSTETSGPSNEVGAAARLGVDAHAAAGPS